MSANITEKGLEKIRQLIQENWQYIEVRDESDDPILRVDLTDARVTIVNDYTDNPLTIQLFLMGGDSDIGVGTKVKSAHLYDVDVDGDALVEVVYSTPVEFTSELDELAININLQIPKI